MRYERSDIMLGSLIAALVLHVLLGAALLRFNAPRVPVLRTVQMPPVAVRTQVKLKPSATNQLSVPPSSRTQRAASRPPSRSASPSSATAPQAGAMNYGTLLPSRQEWAAAPAAAEDEATEDFQQHHFAKGLSGSARQDLMRDGGSLVAAFDIPLVARQRGLRTQASAFVRIDAGGQLWLESLRGEALLRAVLYEALLTAPTQIVLQRILQHLQGQRLHIVLRTIPDALPQTDVEHFFAWDDGRLAIIKSPPISKAASGIVLPDAEAAKAVAWDRAHLSRLQLSAAYRSALQRRLLAQ